MRVVIIFDTTEPSFEAEVFHDGVKKKNLSNLFLLLRPTQLPIYETFQNILFYDILEKGIHAVKKERVVEEL